MSYPQGNVLMQGQTLNPAQFKNPDAGFAVPNLGQQGEFLTTEIHGKYWTGAKRGNLYGANVSAVTVPAIAATLVSVFSLYNPPGSGIDMELVDCRLGQVLATTVVDAAGLYYSVGKNAATATFTTPGTVQSAQIGSGKAGQGLFYTALTHVGTPVRIAMLGSFGAVTDAGMTLPARGFDGLLMIPEGCIVSVAMTTAAGTASGLDIEAWWLEWPNK